MHFARYNESQLRDDIKDDSGDENADAGARTIDFGRFSMEKWNLLDTLRNRMDEMHLVSKLIKW